MVLVDGSGHPSTATTGPDGIYSVSVRQGRYDLGVLTEVPVERVARVRAVDIGPDTRLDVVTLPPYVTLSGTVRNASGQPVADLGVHFGRAYVRTDPNGRYSFTALAGQGTLSVTRTTNDNSTALSAASPLDLTADRTLDLTFGETILPVRVVDQSGAPVPNALIRTTSSDGPCPNGCGIGFELFPGSGEATGGGQGSARTDDQGLALVPTFPVDQVFTTATPRAGLLPAQTVSFPWPEAVKVVEPPVVDPPPAQPAPAPVTWTGVLRHNGVAVQGKVAGTKTDKNGRFTVQLPPGHQKVEVSAHWGPTTAPKTATAILADVDMSGDRTGDIDIPTVTATVHVDGPDGQPVVASVGSVSWRGNNDPIDLVPGGQANVTVQDSATTDTSGNATLVILPGAAIGSYWANNDTDGETGANPAPGVRSVTMRLPGRYSLSGTVRDARGPLPLINWPWVSFVGPASRHETFDGDHFGDDGHYAVTAQAGRRTLIVSDEPDFDEDDTDNWSPNPTLPKVWTMTTDIDLTESKALDLTIPDAAPAHLRAVDADGQPMETYFDASSNHTVTLGAGLTAAASAESHDLSSDGHFDHMLFNAADTQGWITIPTGSWDTSWTFTIPRLAPGDDVALAVSTTYEGDDIIVPDSPAPVTGGSPAPTTTTSAVPAEPTSATTAEARQRGYWALSTDGHVYNFGDAPALGNGTAGAVDLEPTPTGQGYWILNRNGTIQAFGDAAKLGNVDLTTLANGEVPASLSATPSGRGFWVFTNRGRAIPFGDAPYLGDMSQTKLNGPVLGSVATPSGNGYYMVASDGGIFAFGDATFAGSMGDKKLNAPVQSLVPDADGHGYWLVASDGGIFAFDAPFRGSMGATKLNKPVVGMVRYGDGYLMVGADGGIFNFSSAPFSGSLGGNPPTSPVVAVAALPI